MPRPWVLIESKISSVCYTLKCAIVIATGRTEHSERAIALQCIDEASRPNGGHKSPEATIGSSRVGHVAADGRRGQHGINNMDH